MRHRKLIVLGTLLAAACAGDRGEVVAARSALTRRFPTTWRLLAVAPGTCWRPGRAPRARSRCRIWTGPRGPVSRLRGRTVHAGARRLGRGPGAIYAGLQRDGSRDCNGDLRRSLVASWGQLFPSGCGATPCPSLARAWRPGDLSPAAATLLSGLGLSMPPARGTPGAQPGPIPLCNAHGTGPLLGGDADYLDGDPIRRGLPRSCGRLRPPAPSWSGHGRGGAEQSQPVGRVPGAALRRRPVQVRTAGPVSAPTDLSHGAAGAVRKVLSTGHQPDGRNLHRQLHRLAHVRLRLRLSDRSPGPQHRAPRAVGSIPPRLPGPPDNRLLLPMHTLLSPSGLTCTHLDSNEQIGCLSQAGGCTLGFAAASPP